jgi:hypothetical protein
MALEVASLQEGGVKINTRVRIRLRVRKQSSVYCRLANRLYSACPLDGSSGICPFAGECTGLKKEPLRQRA